MIEVPSAEYLDEISKPNYDIPSISSALGIDSEAYNKALQLRKDFIHWSLPNGGKGVRYTGVELEYKNPMILLRYPGQKKR
jgi:hypothetical protein